MFLILANCELKRFRPRTFLFSLLVVMATLDFSGESYKCLSCQEETISMLRLRPYLPGFLCKFRNTFPNCAPEIMASVFSMVPISFNFRQSHYKL